MKKNLLIQEPPLQVLPSLAVAIGLNEAIALQQLHYWLENPKAGTERKGFKWIYNTYEEWQENNFPFWSVRTIQRVFLSLEKKKVVIGMQANSYDRTKHYRIDYDRLEAWNMTNRHIPSRHLGTMEGDKQAHSINESETTSETTSENKAVTSKRDRIHNIERQLPDYPQDLRDLIKLIAIRFGFPSIPKKSKSGRGKYAQWIKETRDLKELFGDYPSTQVIEWAYQSNSKFPREISHPAGLKSLVFSAVAEQNRSVEKQIQDQAQQQEKNSETTIPAPAWVQPIH